MVFIFGRTKEEAEEKFKKDPHLEEIVDIKVTGTSRLSSPVSGAGIKKTSDLKTLPGCSCSGPHVEETFQSGHPVA